MGNLHYYLNDENCFDQFSVIHNGGAKTSIFLNSVPEPTAVQERDVSYLAPLAGVYSLHT